MMKYFIYFIAPLKFISNRNVTDAFVICEGWQNIQQMLDGRTCVFSVGEVTEYIYGLYTRTDEYFHYKLLYTSMPLHFKLRILYFDTPLQVTRVVKCHAMLCLFLCFLLGLFYIFHYLSFLDIFLLDIIQNDQNPHFILCMHQE